MQSDTQQTGYVVTSGATVTIPLPLNQPVTSMLWTTNASPEGPWMLPAITTTGLINGVDLMLLSARVNDIYRHLQLKALEESLSRLSSDLVKIVRAYLEE